MLTKLRRKMLRLAGRLEDRAAKFQGRGWGAGTHTEEVRASLAVLGRLPELAVDIGGNVGSYTEALLTEAPGATIHLFEPASANLEALRQRFAERASVVIVPAAVGRTPGAATLFADVSGSGLASLTPRRLDHFGIALNHREPVRVVRFDDYWRNDLGCGRIDLCKLDIEGHELEALAGFGDALAAVDVLQFEFGGCNIDTRTFFQDFWYFLTERGFEMYRITPIGPTRIARYDERDECFRTTNYIAARQPGNG